MALMNPSWGYKTEANWCGDVQNGNLSHPQHHIPQYHDHTTAFSHLPYHQSHGLPYDSPEYEPELGINYLEQNYNYFAQFHGANGQFQQAPTPPLVMQPNCGGGQNDISFLTQMVVPQGNNHEAWKVDENILTPPCSPKDQDFIEWLQSVNLPDLEKTGNNNLTIQQQAMALVPFKSDFQSITPISIEENVGIVSTSSENGSTCNASSESSCDSVEFLMVRKNPRPRLRPTYHRFSSHWYAQQTEEQRRLRKKEQNKSAATRYRQKKKVQRDLVKSEERVLQDRNAQLRNRCDDLVREIRCLKSIMRDLFKKKGLIR